MVRSLESHEACAGEGLVVKSSQVKSCQVKSSQGEEGESWVVDVT